MKIKIKATELLLSPQFYVNLSCGELVFAVHEFAVALGFLIDFFTCAGENFVLIGVVVATHPGCVLDGCIVCPGINFVHFPTFIGDKLPFVGVDVEIATGFDAETVVLFTAVGWGELLERCCRTGLVVAASGETGRGGKGCDHKFFS